MKKADISVSGLRKIKCNTAALLAAVSGMANTEEINATWKETRIWLAITQPSCRYDLSLKPPKQDGTGGAPEEEYFAGLSRDATGFMASVLFGIRELYPRYLNTTMTCVNCHYVNSKWVIIDIARYFSAPILGFKDV